MQFRYRHRHRGISSSENGGFKACYVDLTLGIWPQTASGQPFSVVQFQSCNDPITDLIENMAAEQKARTTYDNILRMIKIPTSAIRSVS